MTAKVTRPMTVTGTLWGSTDVSVTKRELSQDIVLPVKILSIIRITISN
ncbi:hypothetical protein GCM10011513_21560 [Franconibacter daqui]|nr:hypothetical protein GCM10011513_21560 [Franconibacter daqui]